MGRRIKDYQGGNERLLTDTAVAMAVAKPLERQVVDVAQWKTAGSRSEQSMARMAQTVRRFVARLAVEAVPTFTAVTPAPAGFITASTVSGQRPELATQHARGTTLRTLSRTLRAMGVAVVGATARHLTAFGRGNVRSAARGELLDVSAAESPRPGTDLDGASRPPRRTASRADERHRAPSPRLPTR